MKSERSWFYSVRRMGLWLTVVAIIARGVDGQSSGSTSQNEAGDFASPEIDSFLPEILLTLLNGDEVGVPPLTHHLDIEVRSFDPAEGYVEIYSGYRLLKRILDPPPSEVFSVYLSSYPCPLQQAPCSDSYTAKLYSFESQEPLASASVSYLVQGDRIQSPNHEAETVAVARPQEEIPAIPIMDPDIASSIWPLPCTSVVPFPGFPFPSAYLTRPVIFLAFPPHDLGWMHFDPAAVLKCDPPCLWLMELSCPEAADVLIFSCGYSQGRHGSGAPQVTKLPHQVFLHLCMESTGGRVDEAFMSAMDLTATFQRSSHVPILYVPGNLSLFDFAPRESGKKLAMFVISHCGLERDLYLRQVMRHMQVDSFGKCLQNARFPHEMNFDQSVRGRSNPASPLVPLMSNYKFVFSFENAQETDYVTEKFYIPLLAGSVPVYLGAPNIADFAPHARSFINVRDFAGPAQLAAHLMYLDSNESAYLELHAWRSMQASPQWLALAAQGINQGAIYNEGAVHGTAQRIDASRVSRAAWDALQARVKGSSVLRTCCIPAAISARIRCTVQHPQSGSRVPLQLHSGLRVRVGLNLPQVGRQAPEPANMSSEAGRCLMTAMILIDGEVQGSIQFGAMSWSNGNADAYSETEYLRETQLEGIRTGPHFLQIALHSCNGTRLVASESIHFTLVAVTCACDWQGAVAGQHDEHNSPCFTRTGSPSCDSGIVSPMSEMLRECEVECNSPCFPSDPMVGSGVAVVNLRRRPDRWQYVTTMLQSSGVYNYTRIEAVDGTKLFLKNEGLSWLFRRNHFHSDRAVMGCALSHLRIWQKMMGCEELGSDSFVLVLEDDVELAPSFLSRFTAGIRSLDVMGWDLVCVGARQKMEEHVDFDSEWAADGLMRIRNYRNCHTHAYALKRSAAELLLEQASKDGIICGLDWFMAIQHSRLRSYAFMPSLAGQMRTVADKTDILQHTALWGTASGQLKLAEEGIVAG